MLLLGFQSALLTLREPWSIWRDTPAMRVCNRGCGKMHWHCGAQQSMSDSTTLLVRGRRLIKRIVTAVPKVVLDHSATLVLCEIAAEGC